MPELARELAAAPAVSRPVNGLKLNPTTGQARGNRTQRGMPVTMQRPAEEKALQLMTVPGEWEVLAFYRDAARVKAAVWYLRHHVAPRLPAGTWEFKRCWWERAAVMGRYTPPA